MQETGWRIVIKEDGRWHIGLKVYETMEEATERRIYLIDMGVQPKNIKVITNSELFN